MPIEPVGRDPPMHLAQVHDIARQPHARVIVQVAGRVQAVHRPVDDRHTRGGFTDVRRQLRGVSGIGQYAFMQRVHDPHAPMAPDMAEVLPPTELEHELVLHIERVTSRHTSEHLRQTDQAVRDVRRQIGDGALDRVAAACIAFRKDRVDARQRSLAGRRKIHTRVLGQVFDETGQGSWRMVAGVGIEPTTRGFSIRCSTN